MHPILTHAVRSLSIARDGAAAGVGAELLDAGLALQQALQLPGHVVDDSCVASVIADAVMPQVCPI